MRVLAILLGVGTAVGIAAGVSPAPAASSIQLAQAQDSAAPSGAGAGASQRGSAGNREGGNREGGAAATGGSQERGAATRPSGDPSATTRSETKRTSHPTVRERAGGTRVSVHGSTRRVVGVRAAAGDDAVVIRRKRARTHVYSEPSTTVIRKKRYVHYREPWSTVVIKKRRPAVAVEGVSTRTTVRSNTSTTVRGAGATRESVGASTSVRERSSGAVQAMPARAREDKVARKQPPAAPVAADPPKNREPVPATRPAAASSGLLARASGCSGARARYMADPERVKRSGALARL